MGERNNHGSHQDVEPAEAMSTRRTFLKTGMTISGGLVLSAVYTKPSIQSVQLHETYDPSGAGRTNRGRGKGRGTNKGKTDNGGNGGR